MERYNTGNDSSNETFPSSLADPVQGEAATFKIAKIFFYFLILSASTFGNSMVAHVISTTRKMHSPSNFLILNLAICDLLTPIISIVFDFVLEENNYVWIYGGVMCKLLWPVQTYFTCASTLTLATISLDRYRLIMHPFKTRLSMKQICILILGVHVFSLAAVSPYVYVLNLKDGSCDENWPDFAYRQAYTFLLFLVQYGLPLCFMATMYGLALRALCRTSAKMRENSITEKVSVRRESVKMQVRLTRKISRSQSVKRKISMLSARIDIWSTANAKATKMFIVVVVVFAIFMFPNQVVWLWADFGGGINSPNFTNISIICWLFTYTNSVVNPIIFGVFSKDFRQGFGRVFYCFVRGCSCKSSPERSGEKERLQTVSES